MRIATAKGQQKGSEPPPQNGQRVPTLLLLGGKKESEE